MTNTVKNSIFKFHDGQGRVVQEIVILTKSLASRSAFIRRAKEKCAKIDTEHLYEFAKHCIDAWLMYKHVAENDAIPDKFQNGNALLCSEGAPRCCDAEHPHSHELCQAAFKRLIRACLLSAKLEDVDAKNCIVSALISKILDGTKGKDETLDLCLSRPKVIDLLWDANKKPHYTGKNMFL
jgi:hypothetical protein